jgi:hypothetical protein
MVQAKADKEGVPMRGILYTYPSGTVISKDYEFGSVLLLFMKGYYQSEDGGRLTMNTENPLSIQSDNVKILRTLALTNQLASNPYKSRT